MVTTKIWRSAMSSPMTKADTVSSNPQIQPLTRASVNEGATRRSSAASMPPTAIRSSGHLAGLHGCQSARPHHRADIGERRGLEQAERARDVPPRVVGMAHDVALGAEPDVLAFERVAQCNVRDFLGQSDREADMRAVDRVAQAGIAGARRVFGPALAVHRIEFVGLADVVAERAGEHDVAVDAHL